MAINSSIFIACFILFYLLYWFTGSNVRMRVATLLLFNALFYWTLSGYGIFVLLTAGTIDFYLAKGIHSKKSSAAKQWLLYSSVAMNIGLILGFRHFARWFGLDELPFWPSTVGISFLAFRSMGYVLDIYHENMDNPEPKLGRYFAYTGFFPLILQGPISPARDFLPQLNQPLDKASIPAGEAVFFLVSGIIKKFALAAYITSNFSERVFGSPHLFTGMENLFAAIGQALVVYLDFSGYTDLMLGIGLLLGFRISDNFNFPYLAGNITEYWRRWHMSLSKWLNEYLFFPLSFSLRSLKKWGTVTAVLITFIISGFWHGTTLNYTLWGAMHGLALTWDILSGKLRDPLKKAIPSFIYNSISVVLTFSFLALSGIYFKQENLHIANEMLMKIFQDSDWSIFSQWFKDFGGVFVVMVLLLCWQWFAAPWDPHLKRVFETAGWLTHALILALVIFMAYQISGMEPVPFIYQKF